MVRRAPARRGCPAAQHEVRCCGPALRQPPQPAGHAARGGSWLCGRLRACPRRHRAFAGTHEPHQGNQRRRLCGRGPSRRQHQETPAGSRKAGALLSAGPGQPGGQCDRRQHHHQCRRPALPQIWRHPRLRPRPGSRPRGRHGPAAGRAHPQEQDGLRAAPAVRRLRGPARRRHRGHFEAAAPAAVSRLPRHRFRLDARRGPLPARHPRCRLPARRAGARRFLHPRRRLQTHRERAPAGLPGPPHRRTRWPETLRARRDQSAPAARRAPEAAASSKSASARTSAKPSGRSAASSPMPSATPASPS